MNTNFLWTLLSIKLVVVASLLFMIYLFDVLFPIRGQFVKYGFEVLRHFFSPTDKFQNQATPIQSVRDRI